MSAALIIHFHLTPGLRDDARVFDNVRHFGVAVGAALLAGVALVLRAVLDADWLYVVALALLVVALGAQTLGAWGRKAWLHVAMIVAVVLVAFLAQKLFG